MFDFLNRFRSQKKDSEAFKDQNTKVLISEVVVEGVEGDLKKIAENALTITPNLLHNVTDVKRGLEKVLRTGYFKAVIPVTEDTLEGLKLIVLLKPNDILKKVVVNGGSQVPSRIIQQAFKNMQGKVVSSGKVKYAIALINKWYNDMGVMGETVNVDLNEGTLGLTISEIKIRNVNLKYINAKTQEPSQIANSTEEVIRRHMSTQPDQIYNFGRFNEDLSSIYSTGLFDNVKFDTELVNQTNLLKPELDLSVSLEERKVDGLTGGVGFSGAMQNEGYNPGLIGSLSYSHRNLFNKNKRISLSAELTQKDKLYKLNYQDPWINFNNKRIGQQISIQNMRTSGNATHGRALDDNMEEIIQNGVVGEEPTVVLDRRHGLLEFSKPMSANWRGYSSVQFQRTSCLNGKGNQIEKDQYGCPLYFQYESDKPADISLQLSLRAEYSKGDSQYFSLQGDQALPLHSSWLSYSKVRTRIERLIRIGPTKLNLLCRGGFQFGDLSPFDAFPIGGTNSVRGYPEGGVGTGRHFAVGTTELRVPIINPLEATLFCDAGSDFDSGRNVIGDPAGRRNKLGKGIGVGAGVRVETPLGPLRFEYAWSKQAWDNKQRGRFHLGFGSYL